MAEFTGTFEHQIDSKNRIRIPNKLKGDEEGLYFTLGTLNRIFVYTKSEFDAISEKVRSSVKLTDKEGQKAQTFFFSTSVYLEGDAQGRMILPALHKKFAKIDKDVVFCGACNRIEIWSKESYDEYFDNCIENFDSIFEKLGI